MMMDDKMTEVSRETLVYYGMIKMIEKKLFSAWENECKDANYRQLRALRRTSEFLWQFSIFSNLY